MLEEEKKGPRMWSELFSGGNSLVDGRSNTQAVMDAVTPGAGLLGLGGGKTEAPSEMSSLLSPEGLTAPVSPFEQAKQNHGDGFGFFMKSMLVAKNPALAGWLMPELSASNLAQYKNDLSVYNSIQSKMIDRAWERKGDQEERERLSSVYSKTHTDLTDPDEGNNADALANFFANGGTREQLDRMVGNGAFGNKTERERMLSTYYDESQPLERRQTALRVLNKPYTITTPDGTTTHQGLGLPELDDQGAQILPDTASPNAGSGSGGSDFTPASSAGEREKNQLVSLIGEAEGIYDMEPSFFDAAAAETLPPFVSASLMSEEGQKYEAYKASIKSVIGKVYSGAVLNETEIENVQRGYIPQPGDTKATIALKKRRMRALVDAYSKDPKNFDARGYYDGGGYSSDSRITLLNQYGGR